MDAAGACAVCRHLGKQCDANCILSPYFPAERAQEFKYVHKVFGIHNLTQIVSSVEENERATAVETLIIEAKMRVHDKVHGSYGVEKSLRDQWSNAVRELNLVNHYLRLLRGAAAVPLDGETDAPPSEHAVGPSNRYVFQGVLGGASAPPTIF